MRKSEELSLKVFQSSPDAITISRLSDGCIIDVNEGFETLGGFSREEAIGKTSFELNLWTEEDARERLTAALSTQDGIRNEEFDFRDKQGMIHSCLLSAEVIELDGELHMLSVARDITERKKAEEALRESEENFRNLAQESPNMIFINNLNGVVYANRACEEIMGYRRKEFYKPEFDFMNLIAPRSLKMVREAFRKHLQGEEIPPFEYGLLTKEGRELTAIITTKLIQYSGETAILGIITDVTESKKALEALQRSEEQYRTLVESARDAIFTIADNGIFTSFNSAFRKITGWDRSDWIGKHFYEIVHPDDQEKAIELVRQVMKRVKLPPSELRIACKSGEYVTGEFTAAPQFQEGNIVGMLGIARDVTYRRNLEDQLRQAQRLESIGTLAGGVAHDFNNILNIVLAHSHLLSQPEVQTDQIERSVGAITQAVERGSKVVQQLLTFARQTDVEFRPVTVNDCIREITAIARTTFPKNIKLEAELADDLPPILADATQIHQVLLNLCVNARDAMPHGGSIKISSGLESGDEVRRRFPQSDKNGYVFVEVSDTGTGMDSATRQRIFEPFFTTKSSGKGTGLGLAVVYGIIEDHNGLVTVRSDIGKGSTFRIYLPVLKPEYGVFEEVEKEDAVAVGGTETLLIVEDEKEIVSLLDEYLSKAGYTVLTASDGQEALSIFSENAGEIDLVLSDIGLPEIGGYEILREIWDNESGVKVILASGYFEPETRVKLSEEGVGAFLQKPYSLNDVLNTIRNVLDQPG